KVAASDPYVTQHRAAELKVELFDDLDSRLRRTDFLTVHTPLTDETTGIIGSRELGLMPRGSVVVNAARGGIIDEVALVEALASDPLFAAGLAEFTLEPTTIINLLDQRHEDTQFSHPISISDVGPSLLRIHVTAST